MVNPMWVRSTFTPVTSGTPVLWDERGVHKGSPKIVKGVLSLRKVVPYWQRSTVVERASEESEIFVLGLFEDKKKKIK